MDVEKKNWFLNSLIFLSVNSLYSHLIIFVTNKCAIDIQHLLVKHGFDGFVFGEPKTWEVTWMGVERIYIQTPPSVGD